jgi:hypothetical protein
MDICAECRFYLSTRSAMKPQEEGFCRRYPPAAFRDPTDQQSISSSFAPVSGTMWCGEFKLPLSAQLLAPRQDTAA